MPSEDESGADPYLAANRKLWNKLAHVHAASDFYNVEGFKAGHEDIRPHEIEELGDVEGKDLLHLLCHIGLDTMSWARRGARVTGVDFSEESIATASSIAAEINIPANFLASDIYELPDKLEGTFDIIYMSRGVLGWLPDLRRWAEIIHHFLRPGGVLYVSEIHPIAQVFDDHDTARGLRLGYPYFSRPDPIGFMSQGSYAEPTADVGGLTFVWTHDMSEIVTSLIDAGLRIEFLHEFPFSDWAKPFLVQREDGAWILPPDQEGELPLSFTLMASRGGRARPTGDELQTQGGLGGERFIEANRAVWDDWTQSQASPASFRVPSFKAGETTLQDFEIEELGDVQGRSLLHLQCHFGLDTMSWQRLGAQATGVDFAPKAIERAQRLAKEEGLDTRFICAEVYELPDVMEDKFDIVYTSFGVLAWLRDLRLWGQMIADLLKPGGTFYIAEYHPVTFTLDVNEDATEPVVRFPYFPRSEPVPFQTGPDETQYGWPFSLGAVVTAIAEAGLEIEFLHEFPFSESPSMPLLRRGSDGRWRLPQHLEGELPLLFSLRARKGD